MRELSNSEINFVSGAGFLGSIGGTIGGIAGSFGDSLFKTLTGKAPSISFVTSATSLGQAAGNLAETIFNPNDMSTALKALTSSAHDVLTALTTNITGLLVPSIPNFTNGN